MKYVQNLVLVDDQDCVSQDIRSSTAKLATCKGCVADTHGELCSHICALLTVLNEQRARGRNEEEVSCT